MLLLLDAKETLIYFISSFPRRREPRSIKALDPRFARHEAESRVCRGRGDDELISLSLIDIDALLFVTHWKEFRSPDFASMKQKLNSPSVFDGRNVFEPAEMKRLGFAYFGIGR